MPTKKLQEYNRSRLQLLYFTPAIGWGILILYFSTLPRTEVPGLLNKFSDKLIHASIYFVATFLIYFGFLRFKRAGFVLRRPLFLSFFICVVFGGFIELVQMYFVPGRSGEWLDIAANVSGSLIFVLTLVGYHRAVA